MGQVPARPTEFRWNSPRSGQNSLDRRVLLDAGEPHVQALEFEGQAAMIDAQAVQDRGVEVVNVDGVLDDVVTEVVGLAVDDAGLDAPAGEPDGEALGMMVAAVVVVRQLCPGSRSVRPNSPPQTTRVSSSSPRCFRSLIRA